MGLPSWFQWCYKNRLDLAPRYVLLCDILCHIGMPLGDPHKNHEPNILLFVCMLYIHMCIGVHILAHAQRAEETVTYPVLSHSAFFT